MSKATVDEKDGVLHEEAIFSDNDLSTYHETHAGSLVLDPVCVRLFFFFPAYHTYLLRKRGARRVWGRGRVSPEAFARREDSSLAATYR